MASVISDRQARAVQPGFGMKTPVMAASTGNVTLTSATTGMDGVTPSSGDRLLVWQQTNNWENGIYEYGGSTWNRALDFDGNSDVRFGTFVAVAAGTAYAGKIAKVNSTGSGSNGVHNFAGSSTSDAFTFSMQDFVQSTATIAYGSGGTGSTGFTAFGVVIAGSTALSSLVGSSGRVLIGNGSTINPSFTASPTLGSSGVEQGTLTLQSSGAGKTIIRASSGAVDYTMTWPSSLGSSEAFLQVNTTDGKLTFSSPSTSLPVALGVAAPGSTHTLSRADHVHPTTGLQLVSSNLTAISALTPVAGRFIGYDTSTAEAVVRSPMSNIGYSTGRYYTSEQVNAPGSVSALGLAANTIYAVPFRVRERTTFTRIGVEITAAVAGSSGRLAIYSAISGIPSTLVVDGGNVATATTGEKEATISTTLMPNLYFLASNFSATATVTAGSAQNPLMVQDIGYLAPVSQGSGGSMRITSTFAFGAFPSTFGPIGRDDVNSFVATWLRVV